MQLLLHGPFNFRRQICQDKKVCYQMTFHKLFDFTYDVDDEAWEKKELNSDQIWIFHSSGSSSEVLFHSQSLLASKRRLFGGSSQIQKTREKEQRYVHIPPTACKTL